MHGGRGGARQAFFLATPVSLAFPGKQVPCDIPSAKLSLNQVATQLRADHCLQIVLAGWLTHKK